MIRGAIRGEGNPRTCLLPAFLDNYARPTMFAAFCDVELGSEKELLRQELFGDTNADPATRLCNRALTFPPA
jgi:hypothetical protein